MLGGEGRAESQQPKCVGQRLEADPIMARKQNRERSRLGSKREVRTGVWEISVSSGYRSDGQQRREYRYINGTESDADAALRELSVDMGRSPSMGRRDTIADYWPEFVAQIRAKGVTNATIADYEKSWRLRIEPAFGSTRWANLSFRDIKRWVLTMTHSQAEHAVRCLRRMINCAVDDELIDRNVMDHRRIDYPVSPSDPLADVPVMWGSAHVAEVMSRLRDERIEPLWLTLVGGGLRPEEGLGLWWSDVSFTGVTLMDGSDGVMAHAAITKAWTEADGLHGTKNGFSRRLAPIAEPFSSRLAELSLEGPRVPLWPLYPGSARKEWKTLFEAGGPLAGMPLSRLKDIRSVHETIMQDAGTLDTVNARIHGRSNVQTGYRHYLRPSAALDRAAESMGESVRYAVNFSN